MFQRFNAIVFFIWLFIFLFSTFVLDTKSHPPNYLHNLSQSSQSSCGPIRFTYSLLLLPNDDDNNVATATTSSSFQYFFRNMDCIFLLTRGPFLFFVLLKQFACNKIVDFRTWVCFYLMMTTTTSSSLQLCFKDIDSIEKIWIFYASLFITVVFQEIFQ